MKLHGLAKNVVDNRGQDAIRIDARNSQLFT